MGKLKDLGPVPLAAATSEELAARAVVGVRNGALTAGQGDVLLGMAGIVAAIDRQTRALEGLIEAVRDAGGVQ